MSAALSAMNPLGIVGILLFCCCPAVLALGADAITGTVRNQTTGRPASGDDVVLLRLAEGMQEEARVKTDAQGAFSLNVTVANAAHLVRVLHQGVNYDHSVIGAVPLEIKVFDAFPRVQGVSGNIGIAQVGSDGNLLKVTEMYSIFNTSSPPVTQVGPRNFEITLPGKAAFDRVEVKGPGGIWVKAIPAPAEGRPGCYSIGFPLRPGETLYKFEYHLPYEGRTAFHLKLPYPVRHFAVTHSPSMTFKAARPGTFMSPGAKDGLQIEAATQPLTGEAPAFEVSGAGAIPPPPQAPAVGPAPPVSPTGKLHAGPPPAPERSRKESWLILSGIAALVAIGLLALWRMQKSAATSGAGVGGQAPLLETLKEEMFQLESDRLRGSISAEEYAATKQVLQRSMERAMAGKQPG